jgi:hypothetical protein
MSAAPPAIPDKSLRRRVSSTRPPVIRSGGRIARRAFAWGRLVGRYLRLGLEPRDARRGQILAK